MSADLLAFDPPTPGRTPRRSAFAEDLIRSRPKRRAPPLSPALERLYSPRTGFASAAGSPLCSRGRDPRLPPLGRVLASLGSISQAHRVREAPSLLYTARPAVAFTRKHPPALSYVHAPR